MCSDAFLRSPHLQMPEPRQQPRSDPRWVEARFDRIADHYWFFEKLFMVPKRARTRAVELLQLIPGDRVLSVGCGRGPELVRLSRAVGVNGNVVGVDFSARMLDGAYAQVLRNDLSNVLLVRSDIHRYTAKEPFDAILFSLSLTCFGDAEAVLRHVWDSLKPGGRLVVMDAQIPPKFARYAKPAMPLIRRFMEATVLGDPDMRPMDEMRMLGQPLQVEFMRSGAYFLASLKKPE